MKKLWQNNGMLLVCALLFLVLSLTVPNFATVENAKGLTMSVTTVGIVACTMLFCLAAGDFDLSVGSVVALAGVVTALTINKTNSIGLAIAIPVALGFGVGTINGFVIARLGINALITTLATMQIVHGVARLLADGSSVGISNEAFGQLGQYKLLEFQSPVWVMVLCFVIFGLLLNKTIYGRNTLAIGGNSEAARLSGVNVARTKILIFAVQGAVAALAGVLLASRVSSGQPNTSEGLELQVISGCVLGGVSLTGGVGTISGMIVGIFIMGAVQNAMNLLNIPTFWQAVASGAILLAAVLLDKLKNRKSA